YSAEVHFSTNDPENSFFAVEVFLEILENQAPIANAKTFTLKEDGQIQFNLEAYDPDGDELSFVVTQFPTFGSLGGENQNRSYVPAKNFNGTDTLTFKVSDGRKESALTTISFKVEAVNDAPWAQSFEVNATEDQFFFVDFKYGDIDGDNLNLQLSQLPKNGFIWEDSGKWLYFPNNHFNGEDSLRYIVSDGALESSEATVQIRLQASNDAPVATHFTLETMEDTSVSFAMLGTDVDQDKLSYQVVKEPLHGRLTENANNQWTYVPFEQYSGDDSFSYRPFDGTVHGNIGWVSISVNEVNDAPVVQPSIFSLKEDGNIAIKLIASDPEGDQLVFNIVSQPTNGTLVGEGPRYTYTPTTDFNGEDSFQVTASDGSLNSETALISLVVESQNDSPSFEYNLAALSGGVRETPFRIKLITKDADEDTVSISLSSTPANGACYLEEDELVFLPTPGFTGIENIKLELNDGKVSVAEQLSVTINSHENPYKISFDDQTDPSLINMLYQANEILLQNKKPVFQLEKAVNDQTISANLAVEDDVNTQDLYDWLLNVEDLQGSSFAFHAEEIENRLHWKVSSFLDPVSSVDMDDNTSGNDSGNEVTQEDESDSSQEEELSEDQENTEPNEENGGKNSEEVADEPSVEQLPLIEILGSDWFKAQGIGIFYDAGNGWIYHPEMGWCFLKICTDNNSFWVFHESIGWFWMSQELPNMLYLSNESVNGWFYFPNETLAESTFIYGYENQSWYKWND
ncbi:tandem-95 repeat protein, partial [Opitutales bacterium]|nr:tandem-95 repeat protein [Opitutales bacterium]